MKNKLIVFTDLDGTLLDHFDYSWDAASDALSQLNAQDCPIILNSSKTRAEMEALRQAMGNQHPFIVENGSAVFIPDHYFSAQNCDLTIKRFGPSRDEILAQLTKLRREFGYEFTGFSDVSDRKLADMTGLDIETAHKAKQREASEPLVWEDSDMRRHAFIGRLQQAGLAVVAGGRFLHVMGTVSKADSIEWLMNAYREQYPDFNLISIGLGDSDNDIPMLEAVDIPILITGEHGKKIHVKRDDLIRTIDKGPLGWNQAMLSVMSEKL